MICTDTAAKILDLLRNEKFDLCLVDNWMPDLSGESLCKQIRVFDSNTHTLFYSGAAFDSDKATQLVPGAALVAYRSVQPLDQQRPRCLCNLTGPVLMP
jgi:DNA-binding response OmpR family regulator